MRLEGGIFCYVEETKFQVVFGIEPHLSQNLSQSSKTTCNEIIGFDDSFFSFVNIAVHRHFYVCMTRNGLQSFDVQSRRCRNRQISMPEDMRCSVIQIDRFTNPLPSSDEGSLRDMPPASIKERSQEYSVAAFLQIQILHININIGAESPPVDLARTVYQILH